MNSNTALQDIKDYRIEIVKKLDIIEKDLEMLEILKEWLEKWFVVVQIKVNTMCCIFLKIKCMCIKYN